MCELLGMSANVPTDIRFSLSGLLERGGNTGVHRDGWGIAFYEGKGFRVFRDANPGADSEVARMFQRCSIKSHIVISHIRQANRGSVCLENTHPFAREMWGRHWTFAHNGQLKGAKSLRGGIYTPVGTTDSEYVFCWMLGQIRERFTKPPKRPETLWRFIEALSATISERGVFNFLLSDSRYLYAHCATNLAVITRRAPFGPAQLEDADMVVDFAKETTPNDVVTVIATRPLTTNEEWTILKPGELAVFDRGERLR